MSLSIVGGTYGEVCLEPRWSHVMGSGVRGALAAAEIVKSAGSSIELHTWASKREQTDVRKLLATVGASAQFTLRNQRIAWQYTHAAAAPRVYPGYDEIRSVQPKVIRGENCLVYGMVECCPKVQAGTLVYDPQSLRDSKPPSIAGHTFSKRLAIVANRAEILAMAKARGVQVGDPCKAHVVAAEGLLRCEKASVVVVKDGPRGATVVTADGVGHVPSVVTASVFPIGSGDVFSAVFAALWSQRGNGPLEAAKCASEATAYYCSTRQCTIPADISNIVASLDLAPMHLRAKPSTRYSIYLAGGLFTLPQLWLLEEAKAFLESQGFRVFSPKDDVGILTGPDDAPRIAAADLKGLDKSAVVFALLDCQDPGTLFEVGYAVARDIPVVVYCPVSREPDLTMLVGSGCEICHDFPSALYRAAWRARCDQ